MIKTVADLLNELKVKGIELVKKYEIVDHPVLIGDMYEGLTQNILSNSLFDGLDLRIVSGKITNSKGDISGEIDCMLVQGDGNKLPFTDKYIYHFTQVIAVVEVKKSLYSNTIEDSYLNLRTVIDVSIEPERDGESYIMPALRDAWRSMLRTELPKRSELHLYSERDQFIYHTLLMEAFLPLRIVFGYFGYKSEFSLREGFANYLGSRSENGTARGFGAGSLPHLIICGKNSIIKNNGMPYAMPFLNEEFYWPIYVTSREHPLYHLLEFIWTRLSYKYEITSSIFGNDFELEPVHQYINCKLGKDNSGNLGWMYSYYDFSEEILSSSKSEPMKWMPAFLTSKQYAIILFLCQHEYINYQTDEGFIESVEKDGFKVNDFINSLLGTGLVYEKNNEIRLLTDECHTAILPDGRFCAGENKSGEFMTWLFNNVKNNKENNTRP